MKHEHSCKILYLLRLISEDTFNEFQKASNYNQGPQDFS